MAKNQKEKKRSVVLYRDTLEVVDAMTDEQCAMLFRAIAYWTNERYDDVEALVAKDAVVKVTFILMRNSFERAAEQYSSQCKTNSKNGKKGADARWHKDEDGEDGERYEKVATDGENGERHKSMAYYYNDTNNDTNNDTKDSLCDRETAAAEELRFEDFWTLYDKSAGSRDKAEAIWCSMTHKQREVAMQAAARYVQRKPIKRYRKNASTWLEDEGWNDEECKEEYNENDDDDGQRQTTDNSTGAALTSGTKRPARYQSEADRRRAELGAIERLLQGRTD